MIDYSRKKILDGTDQEDRQLPALDANYFHIDELSFEQLLAMGAEFSAEIPYYNFGNEIDGNWAQLFDTDEAVIMSKILCVDVKQLEITFLNIGHHAPLAKISMIFSLTERIDYWYKKLRSSQCSFGQALANKISDIVKDKLSSELCKVRELSLQLQIENPQVSNLVFPKLDEIWSNLSDNQFDQFSLPNVAELKNFAQTKIIIRSVFYTYLHTISYLISITSDYFHQSLKSQQHEPAIGLFMGFLKLYGTLQEKINRFSRRHLDFYHQKILKVTEKRELPESVFVILKNQSGITRTLVPKNTKFTIGKDEYFESIIYGANDSLYVIDAKIVALNTLSLERNNLISPENELGHVTRIKAGNHPINDAAVVRSNLTAWPIFGAEQDKENTSFLMDAEIGFAIASPLFLLEEGVRKISLAFELGFQSNSDLEELIDNIVQSRTTAEFTKYFHRLFSCYLLTYKGNLTSEHKSQILEKIASLPSKRLNLTLRQLLTDDWQEIFYKLFSHIFCLSLTTDDGWMEINDYIIIPFPASSTSIQSRNMGFRLLLTVGQEANPITPYSQMIHNAGFDTDLPVLQCKINSNTNFYPYSVFAELLIKSVQIEVEVHGVQNVLAHNQHGQLDPSKPFQPFGPLPKNNSYFIFGNYEMARKPLTEMTINIEWGELPKDVGGFRHYYQGYQTAYSTEIFRAGITALSDGVWQPTDKQSRVGFSLFKEAGRGAKVADNSRFVVDVLAFSYPINQRVSEKSYAYNLRARSGFFRLSLIAPDSAFGHVEYPEMLTRTLMENARLKIGKRTPNHPYTPVINRISLNYRASTRMNPVAQLDNRMGEKLFHIHPFGVETLFPSSKKSSFLIPQYTEAGYLFIGLTAKKLSGVITLFFHLSEEIVAKSPHKQAPIVWCYLARNIWKTLPLNRILSDSTHGFLTSGIIVLNVPDEISVDNSIMKSGMYWLRASVSSELNQVCSVYSIQANGLSLTRRSTAWSNKFLKASNQPQWLPVSTIPGIDKIYQVSQAFGGRPKENDAKQKIRICERLRHKNRALLPLDYEQLVLEQVPELSKVKCFSNLSYFSSQEKLSRPGFVLIVVVPSSDSLEVSYYSRRMLNTERLRKIHEYLMKKSSPFAQIEVVNPVYERVQVRCAVNFRSELSDGENINRLNDEISNYISPWTNLGYRAKFGWRIRQKDIESHIRRLPYVEFVTNFSILHITINNDRKYNLSDSAIDGSNDDVIIKPRYPWSLVLPDDNHFIETLHTTKTIQSELTGINELEIGGTLIISGNT